MVMTECKLVQNLFEMVASLKRTEPRNGQNPTSIKLSEGAEILTYPWAKDPVGITPTMKDRCTRGDTTQFQIEAITLRKVHWLQGALKASWKMANVLQIGLNDTSNTTAKQDMCCAHITIPYRQTSWTQIKTSPLFSLPPMDVGYHGMKDDRIMSYIANPPTRAIRKVMYRIHYWKENRIIN